MENRVSRSRFIPSTEEDTVVPNRWQGEADCLVGPFSSRAVAEYFANSVVNTGDRTTTNEMFAQEDGWYLVVRRSDTPVKAVPNKNAEA